MREYGAAPLLLVRLDADPESLKAGLSTTLSGARTTMARPIGNLGFHTEIASVHAFAAGNRSAQHAAEPDSGAVARFLKVAPHYILPLQKRADVDAAFADRISVGRAINKDIVLRQSSISKFHAYFQLDEHDTYYVADAGSKNGTAVNGKRLTEPRELVAISKGDLVSFGSVETLLVDARTLWKALRS